MNEYFTKHEARLKDAITAIENRKDWAAFAEMPSEKLYGEGSKQKGEQAFHALLGKEFHFQAPMSNSQTSAGERTSPYGLDLNISYPKVEAQTLLERAEKAQRSWRVLDYKTHLGISLEILQRLNEQAFLMANAVMHTTGQPFVMSFQAGSAHALDRALEAVAYVAKAIEANDHSLLWEKTVGKDKEGNPIIHKMNKRFVPRGKGIAMAIGCATFPTWNSYPGIFASLSTGNSVIIKPSEQALLPLAITVDIMRTVLQEANLDPDIVQLAVSGGDYNYTQTLAKDSRVKMIDYTGSTAFGDWLQNNCPATQLYLEQAGLNNIFIESTDNLKGLASNIAFSLSLYGGQMCTAPQNIFIPKEGIQTDQGHQTFEQVSQTISQSVDKLLGDERRSFAILGALNSDNVKERVEQVQTQAKSNVVLKSDAASFEAFPNARTAKPLIVVADNDNRDLALTEQFGPIAFVMACDNRETALTAICDSIEKHGAMTTSFYSTDEAFKEKAIAAISDAGSPISVNLTGLIHVNQSAAYSDFHGSALNPAANTTLTDLGFVSQRFGWVTIREQIQ